MFNVLASENISGDIYGKDINIKPKKSAESELSQLKNERIKLERALDRLTNLFLYSEDAMAEAEFIIQKTKLIEQLEEIDEQIGFANSDTWAQSVSDEIFVQRASEFIIAQKLSDRNYINYKRLATSVDAEVLQSFVRSILDSITMKNGNVHQIIFKNGLSHTFYYSDK